MESLAQNHQHHSGNHISPLNVMAPIMRIETTISNRLGLHARASAKLTQLASKFKSEVWISKGARRVNAKSIMGVMMLAAGKGSAVSLEAEGSDAVQALEALRELIDAKFGEPE